MILNVYAPYNKLLEAFGNYQLDDHEPEKVAAGLAKDLRYQFLTKDVSHLKQVDMYILGQWNDETGEFVNDKHLVFSFGDVIAQLEAMKAKEEMEKAVKEGKVLAADLSKKEEVANG